MCSGIRATSPATTWAYLADTVSFRDLVRIGDAIVRIPRDERAASARAAGDAKSFSPRHRHLAVDTAASFCARSTRSAWAYVAAGDGLPASRARRGAAGAGAGCRDPDASRRLLGIADALYKRYAVIVEIEGDPIASRAVAARPSEARRLRGRSSELVRLGARQIRGRGADGPRVVRAVLERRGWRGQLS
jgi:hypothetical protein